MVNYNAAHSYSLSRSGSSEHHKFCECFEIVMGEKTLEPRQLDPLNIFEKWRKVCLIDEDELVCFTLLDRLQTLFQVIQIPPLLEMQEDETGHLRNVLEKDVVTAWHRYMGYLYLLGGIRCPTKVYFKLSTLAGDSR